MKYETNSEYTDACKLKHNDKYSYEKTIYTGAHNKITVTCREHGEYECTAYVHVSGGGVCPECSKTRRLTKEKFEVKSNKVHNFKYNYSKSLYSNNRADVIIICPIHGEFKQTPHSHMNGRGCPKCSDTTKDTETFIRESKKLFGETYGYDKVEYKNNLMKVTLTCREHGDFKLSPSSHLSQKCGCPKCAGLYKTNEEFVADLIKTRGNVYDYSLVSYTGALSYIKIICRIHGVFEQKATNHLHNLQGCPACAKSGFNITQPISQFYIYEFDDFVGYGITNKPDERHKQHMKTFKKHGVTPKLIYGFYASSQDCKQIETKIRKTFKRVETSIEGFIVENTTKENLEKLLHLLKI